MRTHAAADAPPISVLQSLSPPDGTTRFVNQVVEGAPPQVSFTFFSWKAALFGRYDVFHVHWPELLIREKRPAKAFLRRRALSALLLRTRLQRIPIVRTVHNLRPHESGEAAENRSLDALDARTDLFIRLNPTTPVHPESKAITILHGHYRDRFHADPAPATVPGRALYFGLIRPYKGIETLLSVFQSTVDPDLQLRIVGRPSSGLDAVITAAQSADSRISSRLEFVADDVLVDEVCQAELVVLPYREMHNSGALLVALSLNRPVLVPHSSSNAALAVEAGPGWVHLYDGELSREILETTMAAVRSRGHAGPPRLEGRDWTALGEKTYRAYLAVLETTGRRLGARS
jgi:beta-1,4-mannosyltransferase